MATVNRKESPQSLWSSLNVSPFSLAALSYMVSMIPTKCPVMQRPAAFTGTPQGNLQGRSLFVCQIKVCSTVEVGLLSDATLSDLGSSLLKPKLLQAVWGFVTRALQEYALNFKSQFLSDLQILTNHVSTQMKFQGCYNPQATRIEITVSASPFPLTVTLLHKPVTGFY